MSSSSSSSPAEAKRAETDPTGDESGGESVPQIVSQDSPLTETREFPPDASVSARNVITSEQEPILSATQAVAGAMGDARDSEIPTPPTESEIEAAADESAVVQEAIADDDAIPAEAEVQAAGEDIAEIDEELEAEIEEEIDEVAAEAAPAGDALVAGEESPEVELQADADDLVIDSEIDAIADEGRNDLGDEALRADVAAALVDAPAFPEQITPAPEAVDPPFATASADAEFLRRVVLPPPPMAPASAPLPAVGAPPMAELSDGESDDRTVISEPPSPAMLAALAAPPAAPAAAAAAVPFAGWQGRGGRRVSLTPMQLGGLLLVAAVGGGYAGGVLRSTSSAVAVSESASAAPAPTPVITPLPAQEEIIPRAQPATRPASEKPVVAPAKAPAPVAAARPAAAPAAKAPPPATKAEVTPPPAAPAKAAVVAAPAKPVAAAPAKPAVVKAPDRPARRTAAVNRRLAAKKKKFVDPFE